MVLFPLVGAIRKSKPAKLILGMISTEVELFDKAKIILEHKFGKIDSETGIFTFDKTDYYEDEMGKNLKRKFLSFRKLMSQNKIAPIKNFTNIVEKKFAKGKNLKRSINLDPGYVTDAKLVLATTKDYSHRLYLGKGIYAEVTLCFKDGSFRYFDYTYPDYRTPEYINFFNGVRKIYLEQIKEGKDLKALV